jgi:methionyl-tRNA formyltransferase
MDARSCIGRNTGRYCFCCTKNRRGSDRQIPCRVYEHNRGDATPVHQESNDATYCAARNPEDSLICWRWNANYISNFVRAQSFPYPGAFSYLRGRKFTIQKARSFESPYYGTPGKVISVKANEVLVACGDETALIIDQIEIQGVREAAPRFFKGHRNEMLGE